MSHLIKSYMSLSLKYLHMSCIFEFIDIKNLVAYKKSVKFVALYIINICMCLWRYACMCAHLYVCQTKQEGTHPVGQPAWYQVPVSRGLEDSRNQIPGCKGFYWILVGQSSKSLWEIPQPGY